LKRILLILCSLLCCDGLQAQQDKAYTPVQRAFLNGADRILLKTEQDVQFLLRNYRRLYGTIAIRVNGRVSLKSLGEAVSKLDELLELDLRDWDGNLNDETLAQFGQVEELALYVPDAKNGLNSRLPALGKFRNVRLQFESAPDSLGFLTALEGVPSVQFVAPFSAAEAGNLVRNTLQRLKGLRKLSISLNRMEDLPGPATLYSNLEELSIIDNLSWMSNNGWDELRTDRFSLTYQPKAGMVRRLNISYLSDDVDLYPEDWAYLKKLFPSMSQGAYTYSVDTGISKGILSPFKTQKKPVFAHAKSYEALFPEMEPRRSVFELEADKNYILYTRTGNAVMVPSNSLEYANGTPAKGTIQFSVREFIKADEQTAHGSPTHYDSARQRFYLRQRYVVELVAGINNQPLRLKDGNFIRIYAGVGSDSSDRFYAYDDPSGKWQHFYDYDYRFDDNKLRAIDFYSWFRDTSVSRRFAMDKSSMESRFQSADYFYSLPPEYSEGWLLSNQGYYNRFTETKPAPETPFVYLKRGKPLVTIQKSFVDRTKEQGVVKFIITDKSGGLLFPELKAFGSYVFCYTGPLTSKEFSQQFIFRRKFTDVRVELDNGAPVVVMKSEEGYVRIPVDMDYSAAGNSQRSRAEFQNVYTRYRRLLTQRLDAFDKAQRIDYASQIKAHEAARLAIGGKTRDIELRVRSLGVFSWGKPEYPQDSLHLLVKFTDAGGMPVDAKSAFLLLKNPYARYTFPRAETYELNYLPDRFVMMGCQDFKGNVFIINHEKIGLLELKSNSLVYVPAAEVARPLRTRKEYLRILGINERK